MKKTVFKKEKIVRLNFDLSEGIRNAFKAKAASEGLKVKEVLTRLVIDYINKDTKLK